MSVPARTPLSDTDGDDVRVRMRTGGDAVVRPIRPDLDPRAARPRAISRSPQDDQDEKPTKNRNFASHHTAEVVDELRSSWLATQLPDTLAGIAATVIPDTGEANNPLHWAGLVLARLFKLAAHTIGYLICFATGTDLRAGIALTLTLLTTLAAAAIAVLA